MPDATEHVVAIVRAFSGWAIAPTSERALSAWVRERLDAAGVAYVAEATLRAAPAQQTARVPTEGGGRRTAKQLAPLIRKGDRIDYLAGRVGIELKVDGGTAEVMRQLDRYAASPDVDALVLITSRRRLGKAMPATLREKRITTIIVGTL